MTTEQNLARPKRETDPQNPSARNHRPRRIPNFERDERGAIPNAANLNLALRACGIALRPALIDIWTVIEGPDGEPERLLSDTELVGMLWRFRSLLRITFSEPQFHAAWAALRAQRERRRMRRRTR